MIEIKPLKYGFSVSTTILKYFWMLCIRVSGYDFCAFRLLIMSRGEYNNVTVLEVGFLWFSVFLFYEEPYAESEVF